MREEARECTMGDEAEHAPRTTHRLGSTEAGTRTATRSVGGVEGPTRDRQTHVVNTSGLHGSCFEQSGVK